MTDVQDLGSGVTAGSNGTHCFQYRRGGLAIWIARVTDSYPCCYVITSTKIKGRRNNRSMSWNWKTGKDVASDYFTLAIPQGAKEVKPGDVFDVDELLGDFRGERSTEAMFEVHRIGCRRDRRIRLDPGSESGSRVHGGCSARPVGVADAAERRRRRAEDGAGAEPFGDRRSHPGLFAVKGSTMTMFKRIAVLLAFSPRSVSFCSSWVSRSTPGVHGLVECEVIVGRLLTPVSVAGVARSTVWRCAVGVDDLVDRR